MKWVFPLPAYLIDSALFDEMYFEEMQGRWFYWKIISAPAQGVPIVAVRLSGGKVLVCPSILHIILLLGLLGLAVYLALMSLASYRNVASSIVIVAVYGSIVWRVRTIASGITRRQ